MHIFIYLIIFLVLFLPPFLLSLRKRVGVWEEHLPLALPGRRRLELLPKSLLVIPKKIKKENPMRPKQRVTPRDDDRSAASSIEHPDAQSM